MIQLFHVAKTYPGADEYALADVNLNVDKGEFVFLTGPSGAGKTTLLRLLFAAERPSNGQILIGNRNIARLSRRQIPALRRSIGVVFQDFKLIDTRSVFENVALTLDVRGEPRRATRSRVEAVLKRVGLLHKKHAAPRHLSGGEQQRIAIARALVAEPSIVLADEPTGNLDPERSLDIMNMLNDVNARGTTVLVATHDPTLIERFRKRVIALEAGRVVRGGG
ncbi:MAG: cell division ATP-binding protein FtsE [Deltaproteobacteria bacterium]|nr:cell division ATP-binding protein FtsE [Deltaproteobacteria bacterium]